MDNQDKISVDVAGLRRFAEADPIARRAMETLSMRQRRWTVWIIDSVMKEVGAGRASAVELFKSLEKLGCGRMIRGRGRKSTRFRWYYSMASVGKVALGQSDMLEPLENNFDGGDSDDDDAAAPPAQPQATSVQPVSSAGPAPSPTVRMVNYPFPLRSGLLVTLTLPENLTTEEAERIAVFVRAVGRPSSEGETP